MSVKTPVEDASLTPKLIPVTVIDPPPVRGVLSTAALTTALSKLKATSPVPATDETLITPTAHSTVAELVAHASVVADLQADVLHVPAASDPVGVTSTDPKFKPLTVTDALPLRALRGLEGRDGRSELSRDARRELLCAPRRCRRRRPPL